jgi:hypothetical protein
MKTKLFVFTAMFIGGLLFSSCTKDNALLEDTAFAKNESTQLLSEDPDPDPGPVGDPMTNYPDPFINSTTIEYVLEKTAYVRLTVHNDEAGLVQILVNGLQSKGKHFLEFETSGMPAGEYIATLVIGDEEITEVMTKKSVKTFKDDPNIGSDL